MLPIITNVRFGTINNNVKALNEKIKQIILIGSRKQQALNLKYSLSNIWFIIIKLPNKSPITNITDNDDGDILKSFIYITGAYCHSKELHVNNANGMKTNQVVSNNDHLYVSPGPSVGPPLEE